MFTDFSKLSWFFFSYTGVHPYLTALAVAGGIIFIGLEGAFLGPFVLACLMAAFDVFNRIMRESSNTPLNDPFQIKGETPSSTKVWR